MANDTGKAEFFLAFKCPPEHEAEADRFIDYHVK